jgi:hypothetical protein
LSGTEHYRSTPEPLEVSRDTIRLGGEFPNGLAYEKDRARVIAGGGDAKIRHNEVHGLVRPAGARKPVVQVQGATDKAVGKEQDAA